MVFRFFHSCCKLLQRQTYTCLSTRSGIWFCIGGLILLGISTLQFSEVLIEWSMQKYAYSFRASHDNIGGKSYQHRLCLPGPIDVVYTWVNGSDPVLIKELVNFRSKLIAEVNASKSHLTDTASQKNDPVKFGGKPVDNFKWKSDEVCPYPNCVSFSALALSLPVNISKQILTAENPFLEKSNFYVFHNHIDPSIKVLKFENKDDYVEILNKSILLQGKMQPFTRVYITSTIRNGFEKIKGVGILNDIPQQITEKVIKDALEDVHILDTKINLFSNLTVLEFSDLERAKRYLGPLKNQISIGGQKFKVMPATLVWKPMTALELGQDMLNEDISSSRFADNDELKYSLRSVDKYAPWVRKIFIVTNGQIPSWLNLDHPRIKIVTHEELFLNKSHLPTYSSPAIETHIHRIPGLSTKFIYMNDDVFFGDDVWPDDFYTHSKGQKIYLTWPVPNCNEGCPAAWVNDKYCDKPCNVSECDWDGGDCLNTKGKSGWTFGKHTLSGTHYSAIGEYCNGGCANSWIGDRYCDVNCNVKECGFDAGDCGIDHFKELYSFAAKISKKEVIPSGIKAFYINLTSWIGDGILSDGEYVEVDVVRTAVFSKKFKVMTVSLYSNFSETILFKFGGFQDTNRTASINLDLNVTVNTAKTAIPTYSTSSKIKSTAGPTVKILTPFSLYNNLKKRKTEIPKHRSKMVRNNTQNPIFSLDKIDKENLPQEVLKHLNQTEDDFKIGDITQHGYDKRKYNILSKYYNVRTGKGDENDANLTISSYRAGRHLTSVDQTVGRKIKIREEKSSKASMQNDARHYQHMFKTIVDRRSSRYKQSHVADGKLNNYQFLTSSLPWERQKTFLDIINAKDRINRQQQYLMNTKPNRILLDTFASSLLHVSRIYNRAFSYRARKVPAHIPHMVDVDIINEMQQKFWPHFEETSSHQMRSPNDMQFAFSYFYYLMGVPASLNISKVFSDLDTDDSGILSDRELRTLAAKLFPLPLELNNMQALERMLVNCSHPSNRTTQKLKASLPFVNRELLQHCKPIVQMLADNRKDKLKYRYEEMSDDDVTFKMIRNNVSQLVFQLDWIRKNKRKFVCLNDNIDHGNRQAKIIRTILRDFYESMFPKQSQFELSEDLRNRFLKIEDLNSWMRDAEIQRNSKMTFLYVVLFGVFVIIFWKKITRFCRIFVNLLLSLGRKTKRRRKGSVDVLKI